jgi:nitrite reductase (NADH) large subunit
MVQELRRRTPGCAVVLYGDEPWEPYNRVRLSSFLGGELKWHGLTRDLVLPEDPKLTLRYGCAVTAVDPDARRVHDAHGRWQSYSQLILATGSRPHVPEIPGIDLNGVYTFRNMADAQKLAARRVRSRRTVVLGGGLLGLEAARGMQRFHTDVCIIEHYSRLMMRQLDDGAAATLAAHVRGLGIRVVLGEGIKRVLGERLVSGVELRSGEVIDCDTLIVATGIRPNVDLARKASLALGRGIRVDDRMQTSVPDIYAVGECAEHRDRVYGLVAPGLEQAAVAAHSIAGGTARYAGSAVATRLKVLDLPVFSMGPVGAEERPSFATAVNSRADGSYRSLVVERGRLVGAIAVGECPDLGRLQEAVGQGRRVWPWQSWRFRKTGSMWAEAEAVSVVHWPAATAVCNCTGVTRGALGVAMASGYATVETLIAATGASTVCGSCRPLLAELVGGGGPTVAVRGARTLLSTVAAALIAALLLALVIAVPYAASVQVPWQWDVLWRDGFWKQVSGFTVVGLSVALLVLSLRKRIRRFTLGEFSWWRVAHALLGGLTLAGLAVHTGGRLGANLDFMLMAFFLGMVIVGAASGAVIALEHRLGGGAARMRRMALWMHILLFWPVPVLLASHVFKTYYF